MKSPFPGMDPFLEPYWLSVHASLVVYAMDQLQPNLARDLWARANERVFVEARDAGTSRGIYSDVAVLERPWKEHAPDLSGTGTLLAEPVIIHAPDEPLRQRFIEIVDVATGSRVITVIEIVSPTNKRRGAGRRKYRQKQRECEAADVNLVEIDLTRAGKRELLVPDDLLSDSVRTTYQACVWRATQPARFEVYRIPLQQRLPPINVPLRPGEADVTLELQPLIDKVYESGRYDRIEYHSELHPPLNDQDQIWVNEILKAHLG